MPTPPVPLAPSAVVDRLVATVLASPAARPRVALDGAPVTRPDDLADALVDPLRAAGRPVVRAHARDFLRPASIRLEHGHHDADALLEDWLDERGLRRELLDPFVVDGRHVRSLWDAERDRATRAPYETAPLGSVLLLDGALLLGRGLPFDLAVHLAVRTATLERRTPDGDRWTLPAFERYDDVHRPADVADVVLHVDDPRRPAWSG
ncbi:hypothetical protein [Cellulomonas sp. HZM]|uniref:hypothetical protein n=1 Tax=Cellulomonas sp. HZM TaxID=1454010 RepID=UPI0004938BA6|nr:hypothetical protein [Cellulomonas sp. HZM]